ncbi:hypothetical protein KUV78_05760 [Marinobacter hydrocarbonoclasticus]|uniref:hypothetical protein n=1 Tax=Marinobacter nauticus TaxID=2743 RepID=UPI001C945ECF|nr:hypothetical protein [Marinobacter nauticus]MBY6193297.1 hypothetical protein [Marinobacter nauticus]MBY6214445.1 hypothetical protein [Marinobacter nauticus]
MRANTVAKHLMIALAIALLVLASGWLPAQESCTYRKNTLGGLDYRCKSGETGSLRKDILGDWNDNRTGIRYRQDRLGQYRSADGKQVWRKDALGNWRDGEGRECRERLFGRVVCE